MMSNQTTARREFQTKTGLTVEVTGNLITSKDIFSDGYNTSVPTCEIVMQVIVNGSYQGRVIHQLTEKEQDRLPAGYTHCVGKLALRPADVKIINSVREELEATPEWSAKQSKIQANKQDLAKHNADRRNNGYCEKCQSYCYGDCDA